MQKARLPKGAVYIAGDFNRYLEKFPLLIDMPQGEMVYISQ